jgi:imidazolonepropionase-like amidohydrolase
MRLAALTLAVAIAGMRTVPTAAQSADVYNDDYILAEYKRLRYPDRILEKERQIGRLQRENFRRAAQAGVKIACGVVYKDHHMAVP